MRDSLAAAAAVTDINHEQLKRWRTGWRKKTFLLPKYRYRVNRGINGEENGRVGVKEMDGWK